MQGLFLGVSPFVRRAAFACALAVAGCGGGSSSGGAGGDPVGEFAKLVNDHRASVSCGPLAWDGRLAKAAQAHSDDMARRKYVSHVSPEGTDVKDRLRQAGYSAGGENIAAGYGTAAQVLAAWLDSPAHRSNIENCAMAFHGVGMTASSGVWTHLVAR